MPHMVIIHTTEQKSFYPCDDLDAAVATIERFRNEDNVESCELFELSPISFEFKPYYHVALSTGSVAPSATADAPGVVPTSDLASNLSSLADTPPVSEAPSAPFLSAVESPSATEAGASDVFDPAPSFTPLSESFATTSPEAAPDIGMADAAPSALDTTLANVGVPTNPPIPPLPEAIPPAPAFGEALAEPMSPPPAVDPFSQSPADAAAVATGAPSGFGFELGNDEANTGFDPFQADEPAAAPVTDLFESGAELPPPPPPPPLEAEVEEEPRRGLFGR